MSDWITNLGSGIAGGIRSMGSQDNSDYDTAFGPDITRKQKFLNVLGAVLSGLSGQGANYEPPYQRKRTMLPRIFSMSGRLPMPSTYGSGGMGSPNYAGMPLPSPPIPYQEPTLIRYGQTGREQDY